MNETKRSPPDGIYILQSVQNDSDMTQRNKDQGPVQLHRVYPPSHGSIWLEIVYRLARHSDATLSLAFINESGLGFWRSISCGNCLLR